MLGNLALSSECAVLFADLIGSSQLYERIGDGAAFALVDKCLKTMSKVVEKAGGRVVKNTGDGLMAAFWMPTPRPTRRSPCNSRCANCRWWRASAWASKVGFHSARW